MFGKKKTLGKLKKGLKITAPPVEEKPYKV
jgi:hypothetical protein